MTLKHSNQLVANNMEVYTNINDYPINEVQDNLFTLRADLCLNFDQGAFIFVPKCIHQSGILYHDTLFNDYNHLAHGFMLARFGWAVIRLQCVA